MNYRNLLLKCCDLYMNKYSYQTKVTLSHKKYVLNSFLQSLPADISNITTEEILDWQCRFNVASNTLNGHLVILRQFLIFAQSQGLRTAVPTIKKYTDDYLPYLFSPEELSQLLEVADNNISHSPSASTKTFCIPMVLRLLAYCGTRLSETLSLKWEDYDCVTGVLIFKNSKGKKQRYVPIHSSLNEMLLKYRQQMQFNYSHCQYLFPDNSLAKHITKQQFEYEFNKIRIKAKILPPKQRHKRGVCAHCLRHTFAVNSFRNSLKIGVDITETIPILSTYLGHERLKETEKYLKFSTDLFPDSTDAFGEYSSDVFKEVML